MTLSSIFSSREKPRTQTQTSESRMRVKIGTWNSKHSRCCRKLPSAWSRYPTACDFNLPPDAQHPTKAHNLQCLSSPVVHSSSTPHNIMKFLKALVSSLLFLAPAVCVLVDDESERAMRDLQIGMAGLKEAAQNPELLAQLMHDLQVRLKVMRVMSVQRLSLSVQRS